MINLNTGKKVTSPLGKELLSLCIDSERSIGELAKTIDLDETTLTGIIYGEVKINIVTLTKIMKLYENLNWAFSKLPDVALNQLESSITLPISARNVVHLQAMLLIIDQLAGMGDFKAEEMISSLKYWS